VSGGSRSYQILRRQEGPRGRGGRQGGQRGQEVLAASVQVTARRHPSTKAWLRVHGTDRSAVRHHAFLDSVDRAPFVLEKTRSVSVARTPFVFEMTRSTTAFNRPTVDPRTHCRHQRAITDKHVFRTSILPLTSYHFLPLLTNTAYYCLILLLTACVNSTWLCNIQCRCTHEHYI